MNKSTKFLALLACTANLAVLPSVCSATPSLSSLGVATLSNVTPSTPKAGATFTISAYENLTSLEMASKASTLSKVKP